MPTLQESLQVLLFLIFALGGAYRFFQPIDVLAKRMLWVNYFKPITVRTIAVIEVLCGTGMLLALLLSNSTIPLPPILRMPAHAHHARCRNYPCYHWRLQTNHRQPPAPRHYLSSHLSFRLSL